MSGDAQFRLGISIPTKEDFKHVISAKDIFDHIPHYIGPFDIKRKSIEPSLNQLIVQIESFQDESCDNDISTTITTIEIDSIHFDRENLESSYTPFMTGTTRLLSQDIQLFRDQKRTSFSPTNSSPLPSSSISFNTDAKFTILDSSILYHFKELTTALIVAIPSIFTIADLMQFLIAEEDGSDTAIEQVRIIHNICPNRFMAIVRFRSPSLAIKFKNEYDGKLFIQGRSEQCHILWLGSFELKFSGAKLMKQNVKQKKSTLELESEPIKGKDNNDHQLPSLPPLPSLPSSSLLLELPTCPRCLERIDECISGVSSGNIKCASHEISCPCISKWIPSKDSCKVCRTITLDSNAYYRCLDCKAKGNLWCCLVCGNLGCGRYLSGHAKEHYLKSGHSFSLDLESQGIWDYQNERFVHRLIQNKYGRDIVEIPIPNLEKKPIRKSCDLKAEAEYYNSTLHAQLESSQLFHEDKIKQIKKDFNDKIEKEKRVYTDKLDQLEKSYSRNLIEEREKMKSLFDNEITQLKKSIENLENANKKLSLELNLEKSMNQQLFKVNDEIKKEFNNGEIIIKNQEEQIRDLIAHLTLGTRLEDACNNIKEGKLILRKPRKKAS